MESLISNMSAEELDRFIDSAAPQQMELIARRAIKLAQSENDGVDQSKLLRRIHSWLEDCPI